MDWVNNLLDGSDARTKMDRCIDCRRKVEIPFGRDLGKSRCRECDVKAAPVFLTVWMRPKRKQARKPPPPKWGRQEHNPLCRAKSAATCRCPQRRRRAA